MKKLMVILAVLVMAPVVMAADVDFSVDTTTTAGEAVIKYTVNAGSDPVGFALDIDTTNGATIDSIKDGSIDSFFDVFIDLAFEEEQTGGDGYTYGEYASDESKVVADQDVAGNVSLPSGSFCLSLAGLGGESTPLDAPPTGTVNLLTLVDADGGDYDLCLNAARGDAVVSKDGVVATNLDSSCISFTIAAASAPCFDSGHADYTEWQNVGEPECWCYTHQCEGDANGAQEGSPFTGYYYVGSVDLGVLVGAWKDTDLSDNDPAAICADFSRSQEGSPFTGYYRVGSVDLGIMVNNWKDDSGLVGGCGGSL